MRLNPYLKKSKTSNFSISFEFNKIVKGVEMIAKRIFDIIMALSGLIILAPAAFYISYLIKKDSSGPIYFSGLRMGKDGKSFRILKFRTMYERPESYQGPRVTAQGDDRITPLGHWLRDTKMNELPQLWNVLIGNMSFVGPRPEDVEIAKTWPEDASKEILSVRPGITSPASVLYHNEEEMLSNSNVMEDYYKSILPEKMRLDRLYVRHHSFISDLDTIFWTLAVIIPRLADYKIPEGYLFAGPLKRFFNRHVSWLLKDMLVSIAVAYSAGVLWQATGLSDFEGEQLIILGLILALLFNIINSIRGLNHVLWSRSTVEDGFRLISSSVLATSLVFVFYYFSNMDWALFPLKIPGIIIYLIGLISGAGSIVIRYRLRILTSLAGRWMSWRQPALNIGERVLLVGTEEGNQNAKWLLQHKSFRTAFTLVGAVDNEDPTKHGMRVNGLWMLGSFNDTLELVEKHDVGVIISTYSQQQNFSEIEKLLNFGQDQNTRLILVDDLFWMINQMETKHGDGDLDSSQWVKEKLEFKALHDAVTKLPNRTLLRDRLNHSIAYARRYQTQHAILFIELEGLSNHIGEPTTRKLHTEGMKIAAKRLNYCKRDSDTLARYGENSFVLILENVRGEEEVSMIGNRIFESLTESFMYYRHEIVLGPIINVCMGADLSNGVGEYKKIDINSYFDKSRNLKVFNNGEYNVEE